MRGRSSRGAPGEPQAGHGEEIPHGKATKIWNALPKELWRALEVSRVGLVTKWGQNQAQVGLDDLERLFQPQQFQDSGCGSGIPVCQCPRVIFSCQNNNEDPKSQNPNLEFCFPPKGQRTNPKVFPSTQGCEHQNKIINIVE